jgi:hypothetical protein
MSGAARSVPSWRARSFRTSWITDPRGSVAIRYRDGALVGKYRFGHSTADFIVCRECGVVVAAISEIEGRLRAVVNIRTMPEGAFTAPPVRTDFAGESVEDRLARRARNWIGAASLEPAESKPLPATAGRQRVFSGTSFEKAAAYSRATRVRDLVFVAGTTAVDETGRVVGPGDLFAQTDSTVARTSSGGIATRPPAK